MSGLEDRPALPPSLSASQQFLGRDPDTAFSLAQTQNGHFFYRPCTKQCHPLHCRCYTFTAERAATKYDKDTPNYLSQMEVQAAVLWATWCDKRRVA